MPYNNNVFDFVTIFQVLHHFENLIIMLTEIRRVCRDGCVLVIRDHDISDPATKRLTDLKHLFYAIFKHKKSVQDFSNNYFSNYKSINEWDDILQNFGFTPIYKKVLNNTTCHFYGVYILTKSWR